MALFIDYNSKFSSVARYGVVFRIFFLTYLDMLLFALLQVHYRDFSSTIGIASTSLSIVYILQSILVVFSTLYLTYRYTEKANDSKIGYLILVEYAGYDRGYTSY
jgi:hypothetical protein